MSTLPTQLETKEDYELICKEFLRPLLVKKSKEIATVIEELHTEIKQGEIDRERIDYYLHAILEITAFCRPSNPMYPYFESIIDLEQKLKDQGEI